MCKGEDAAPDDPNAHVGDNDAFNADCQGCVLTNLHVFVVSSVDHATPIGDAEVTVVGLGSKPTVAADGSARWRPIQAGRYRVTARKALHGPDPAASAEFVVAHAETREITLELEPFELHLHVDADRDGAVDAGWTNNQPWTPGGAGQGAIIFFNNDNDDDDAGKERDFENSAVDTAADIADFAPLHLRRHPPGATLPATVTAELTVADRTKIRIVQPRAAAGAAIVGPGGDPASHVFDNGALTASADIGMGMEGLRYPNDTFDGKIAVTLQVSQNGAVVHTENIEVRVAPWVMFHHANITEKVYMAAAADNGHIRTAIRARVGAANLLEPPTATYNNDRWMQDGMEPGYAIVPAGAGPRAVPATLRTPMDRGGELDTYPKAELLRPDYGFHEARSPTALASSLDSFGNLECSPPFTHRVSGRRYPFGRIVYGGDTKARGVGSRRMLPWTRNLLAGQQLQDPIEIDSDWLAVGHVDEFISFLPNAGGTHGWKVLIAAPALALQTVLAQPDATPLFHGANLHEPHLFRPGTFLISDFPLRTVGAIRASRKFKRYQSRVQRIINDVKNNELKPGLDLEDDDFVPVPILFTYTDDRYIAYTAGSVNMLVITEGGGNRLIVPKPYGPFVGGRCLFEQMITANIGAGAASINYVDDLQSYHTGMGEIHCGSNSQRTPQTDRWWDLPWIV